MSTVVLTAYNVKTKEKNVPIMDAVISKTAKGAYMAQGHDGKGNKLTTLLGEEKAMADIKNVNQSGDEKHGGRAAGDRAPADGTRPERARR